MAVFFVVVVIFVVFFRGRKDAAAAAVAAGTARSTTTDCNFAAMGARASKKLPSPNKCSIRHLADNVLLFVPKKKAKHLPFILLKETTPFARFCVLAEENFDLIVSISNASPPFLNPYGKNYPQTQYVSSSGGDDDDDDDDDDDGLIQPADLEAGERHQQVELDVYAYDSETTEVGAYEFSNSILSPLDTVETDERQGAWYYVTELSLWFSFSAFLTFQRLAIAQVREDDPGWKSKHAAEANEWFLKNDQFRAHVRLFVNDLLANGQLTSSVQEIRVLLQDLNEKESAIFLKR